MPASSHPNPPAAPSPESGPATSVREALPPLRKTRQSRLRLAISVPALLVLITLSFGLVSYLLITSRWGILEAQGLDGVAAELLEAHLIAMIVMVVISVVGGLGIVFTILRPIRVMEDTARRIVEGRLDQRVPAIRSSDEIGSLSRSFNSMIDFLNDCIEERNRYMVEGIMTGLLLVDLEGRIKALNSTGAQLLGLDSSWAIGRTIAELPRNASHPESTFWNEVENVLETSFSRMDDEIIINTSLGDVSLMVAVSVVRDAADRPFGLMLNFRDASEIRMLNEQLSKADQLAALGTFTMGLAHELRNPLGSIKGMIQLMELETPETGESREIFERIVREVNRLDQFVRELLDFSQDAPAPHELLDLKEILETSIAQVKAQFESNGQGAHTLLEDLPDLPRVTGEPDRLVQAFSNMIRNAYESARPGSEIGVRAALREDADAPAIDIHIRNTGSTIKANDLNKIFDPFFTTKKKGNGLGLAIAYQILTQNGAAVDLDVGPDEVDFIVTFPVKTADAAPAGASAPRTAASLQEESSAS